MSDLTISKMTINHILEKDAFVRMLPGEPGEAPQFIYPTQEDFLREYYPSSHRINSIKYFPNMLYVDETAQNKIRAKILTRVAIAWQQRIHTKRTIALTGYEPDITSSRSKSDKASQQNLADFKEGWSIKGMDTAIHLAIKSDLKVGDVAICGYKSNGKFGYRIFSFDRGDTLFPHFDPMTGELVMFARRFKREIVNAGGNAETVYYIDVWDEKNYIQYRQCASWEANDGKAQGWVVSVGATPHKFPFCPVAYHRYGEPCWAGSQSLIERHELSMSQLAENNAQYALRILYTLGADFEMEGTTDGTPRLISSSSTDAKLGFLEPADSSSSFDTELSKLEKEIMRCSFAVESPELKSGSDVSSLTVKTLMADSYLKALDDAKEYQGFLNKVVDIFIEGYGTESEKRADFLSLNIQITLQPWTFMAESEVVNTLVQLVSVGVLSRKSATEYAFETLGLGTLDEANRLLHEEHDKLVAEGAIVENQSATNVVNTARNAQ